MAPTEIPEHAWLKSEKECLVKGVDDSAASQIWFKSKPLERNFCYRVTQLQLCTDSQDQGWVDKRASGNWTWFELVILPGENATQPRVNKEGKELAWRSHNNKLGDLAGFTRHFGVVFDRRSQLLANLEVGDVLAVRVCARFSGWENKAKSGYIVARVLNEDLFTPHFWTLTSDVVPTLAPHIVDGSYSFVSTSSCVVKAVNNELQSKIWFTTPALDQDYINRLEAVQLITKSRYQLDRTLEVKKGDSFSWFDIVILKKPTDTVPKTETGVSLVWLSHSNGSKFIDEYGHQGQLFDEEDKEQLRAREIIQIKGSLEPGDVIGVRVCAQFPGWENYAEFGQLVVRLSHSDSKPKPVHVPDVAKADHAYREVQDAINRFYREVSPNDEPVYRSATVSLLSAEARADQLITDDPPPPYEKRPLRLLSLDGGGVRGVSSLRILKRIMEKVAEIENKPDIQPWQYFDMMAGTSTGGLIALMLGRLHMTVEECEAAYNEITKRVFEHKSGYIIRHEGTAFISGSYLYEAKPLEDAIREYVAKKLGDPEAQLTETSGDPECKVLVMAALASKVEDGNTAVHLRSYDVGPSVPSEYTGWPIWKAARATSAAPVFFKSFENNGKVFVDGGLGWNNPVLELIADIPAVFGKDRTIGCLLSLGTGIPPEMQFGTGLSSVKDFVSIATNSERAHLQVMKFSSILPRSGDEKYWRFNLSKQLSDKDWVGKTVKGWFGSTKDEKLTYEDIMVKMDDWEGIEMIRTLTDEWLKRETKGLTDCAQRLSMGGEKN
ncbi:hypothetical protein E1B28_007759 [Marasmius oreades]|uniref:PNPLA domain-containing protein n=1 Tax=Marasmius oreades TaxID=181124 RepID=A0A9P7S305_9AGAR|nr:uncharacterized protein E1B28_007759 [Marasmius oreades]KAG7094147.1 hypothetical protein E1B28_007759 [Marasmius oreades]